MFLCRFKSFCQRRYVKSRTKGVDGSEGNSGDVDLRLI